MHILLNLFQSRTIKLLALSAPMLLWWMFLRFELNENEHILTMKTVFLRSESTRSGQKVSDQSMPDLRCEEMELTRELT